MVYKHVPFEAGNFDHLYSDHLPQRCVLPNGVQVVTFNVCLGNNPYLVNKTSDENRLPQSAEDKLKRAERIGEAIKQLTENNDIILLQEAREDNLKTVLDEIKELGWKYCLGSEENGSSELITLYRTEQFIYRAEQFTQVELTEIQNDRTLTLQFTMEDGGQFLLSNVYLAYQASDRGRPAQTEQELRRMVDNLQPQHHLYIAGDFNARIPPTGNGSHFNGTNTAIDTPFDCTDGFFSYDGNDGNDGNDGKFIQLGTDLLDPETGGKLDRAAVDNSFPEHCNRYEQVLFQGNHQLFTQDSAAVTRAQFATQLLNLGIQESDIVLLKDINNQIRLDIFADPNTLVWFLLRGSITAAPWTPQQHGSSSTDHEHDHTKNNRFHFSLYPQKRAHHRACLRLFQSAKESLQKLIDIAKSPEELILSANQLAGAPSRCKKVCAGVSLFIGIATGIALAVVALSTSVAPVSMGIGIGVAVVACLLAVCLAYSARRKGDSKAIYDYAKTVMSS